MDTTFKIEQVEDGFGWAVYRAGSLVYTGVADSYNDASRIARDHVAGLRGPRRGGIMTTEDAVRARLKLGALTHSEVIRTGGLVALTLLRQLTKRKRNPVKFAYLDVGGSRQCVYYMEAP